MQPRPVRPSPVDKQATVYGAVHTLKPWEVAKPSKRTPSGRWEPGVTKKPPPPPSPQKHLDTRYKAALAAPVNAKIKVPGQKKRVPARQYLADTMTADEKKSYLQQYINTVTQRQAGQNGDHGGFLDALTRTPGSVYSHGLGPVLGRLRYSVPKQLGGKEWQGDQPSFTEALQAPPDLLLGKSATNLLTSGRTSDPVGAGLELATLPLVGGRLLHAGEEVGRAAMAARASGLKTREAVPAIRSAVGKALGLGDLTKVSGEAANNPLIRSAARTRTHAAIDQMMVGRSPVEIQALKDGVDAQAHIATKDLKPKQAKAAARQSYKQIERQAVEAAGDGAGGIRTFRNARVEAVRNPHYAPLPRGGVKPLDEAATAAYVKQSIADAGRMTSISRSPARLNEMFREAHRLAATGVRFRKWYEVSAKRILSHVHGDLEEADKLAQLHGIYSANRSVDANSVLALRAYDEAVAGLPITQGSGPQIKAATKVMKGIPWDGRKTNSFYSNMLKHIDPEKYRSEFGNREVTVDIWMMRMFGFKGKSPTGAQYNWIENHIRELARQLGWTPEEVQAATWVALKAQSEGTSMEMAAYDFAHGIDTHLGKIMFKADPEAMKVIAPEGRNLIHEIVGVPGTGGHAVPSGERAHYIPLLRAKGEGGDFVISDAERKLAEEAAAAHGRVLDLPKVAYGRIFQAKTRGEANAVELRIPGGLSTELEEALVEALGRGTDLVHTRAGAWLLQSTKKDNKAWLDQMSRVLQSVDPKLERQATAVAYDGGVVERSHYDDLLERLEQRRPGAGASLHELESGVTAGRGGAAADLQRTASRARTTERTGPGAEADFDSTLARSRAGERGAYLSDTPAAELVADGYRLFMGGPDDAVHYALHESGDFGYFASRTKGDGRAALAQAITEGARTLDAFDGGLIRYYEQSGFREVARTPWDDAQAPKNWNLKRDGRPDIVHMAYRPDLPIERSSRLVKNWEAAKKLALRIAREETGSFTPGEFLPRRFRRTAMPEEAGAGEGVRPGRPLSLASDTPPKDIPTEPFLTEQELAAGATPEERMQGAIPRAKRARKNVDVGYSVERGQRFDNYEQAYGDAVKRGLDPETAHIVALQELKGELQHEPFKGFDFSDAERQEMIRQVHEHPDLKTGQKVRVTAAIRDGAKGKTPQLAQIVLLEKVFGKAKTADFAEAVGKQAEQKLLAQVIREIRTGSRTLQSTLDISYLLRQGLVSGARHPVLWKRGVMPSFKAMSKKGYDTASRELALAPGFDEASEAGVHFTEVGAKDLAKTEEAYQSTLLAKVPGISHSGNAYTFFLNKNRLDLWNALAPMVERNAAEGKGLLQAPWKRGQPRDVDKALKDLARYINSATGRGTGGEAFERVAPHAASVLFSPRLLRSRFNFLNPVWYARMDPAVRRQALQAATQTVLGGMAFLYAASNIPGVTVGLDPTNANFGRIRIGDTRIDLWGGFQPLVRLYAQLLTGVYTVSTTPPGEVAKQFNLAKGGFGKSSRYDISLNFLRSKLAPNVSLLVDWLDNQNAVGQPFQWRDQWRRAVPMIVTDLLDTYQKGGAGVPGALGAGALASLGIGVQTYPNRPHPPSKGRLAPPGGGGGGLLSPSGGGAGLLSPSSGGAGLLGP